MIDEVIASPTPEDNSAYKPDDTLSEEQRIEQEYKKKVLDPFNKNVDPATLDIPKVVLPEKIKSLSEELPDEFNVKHIGDLEYLLEIFSSKYDKYHSLVYLQKMRKGMLEEGYQDGSTLNEFLFWTTMSRKLQIIYQRMHAKLNRKKGVTEDDTENMTLLKEMRAISGQVASLQSALDGSLDKRKKIKDVVDLHADTMKDAEEFVRSHIGEHQFMCKKCGSMVDSQGLPHFAIMTEKDDKGEVIYHVFSPEIWFLIRQKLLPLNYAAFILRTSPEGVLITAEQRKEYGSQVMREDMVMLEEEERNLRSLIKDYHHGLEAK